MRASTAFAVASLLLVGSAGAASGEILLDYRDERFVAGTPFYAAAERRRIAAVLSQVSDDEARALGDDFAILGDAPGSFTGEGRREHVHLLQSEPAIAIEPFPDAPAPLLLVTDGEGRASVFALPGDVQYQRLVAAGDGNGDGRDEILLETAFVNMGQSTVALDVVRLDEAGSAVVENTLTDVLFDGCEAPVGPRERHASTVSATEAGFVAERFGEGCD